MEERKAGTERLFRAHEAKETAVIQAIITDLTKAIEKELAEPGYRQLEFFTYYERSQLMRVAQALRTRMEQIPAEIEAEQEVIRGRFSDSSLRLFPVAVAFLVLERLA